MFALIGVIAVWFPEILGNGKAGNQLTFGGLTGWQYSLELTAVKWAVVLMALAAGAYGGLITPSMMLGSTISFAAAAAWNSVFPKCRLKARQSSERRCFSAYRSKCR